MRIATVGFVLSLVGLSLTLPLLERQSAPATPRIETYRLRMRDGTHLATDVYLPTTSPPYPVLVVRTPYDKRALKAVGEDGARRGYAMVIQDTRGRYDSEGANLPFEGDGWWENRHDGEDTLQWVARQPWCNGKIGTLGGSALGINQILLAGTGTPYLIAQHITVATPNLHASLFPGGVLKKALVERWLEQTRHAPEALTHWTRHPEYNTFWRTRDASLRYSKVRAPAVHIGGYYDIFAQGTLDAFVGYQTQSAPTARGKQKLLMGPWDHGVLRTKVGDVHFPNADKPPCTFHDAWRWFDHTLKGEPNGVEKEPPVVYYVMGALGEPDAPGNEWRTAQQWPPLSTRPTPLYLHADGGAGFSPPTQEGFRSYTYDPSDPVPTLGGRELNIPAGIKDQRPIESRADVLVFTTEPLKEPLEVIGRVKAVLWVSSDAPDTDFLVRLCDVYPDGRSYNIVEGVLRARYHRSLSRATLLQPNKVYRLEIDLWSTAIVFNRGHRLRVHITSSSVPGYDPNPNTGAPFRANTQTRIAQNRVYLSKRYPSHLILPCPSPPQHLDKKNKSL